MRAGLGDVCPRGGAVSGGASGLTLGPRSPAWARELRALWTSDDATLAPSEVVAWAAARPKSALYAQFMWDDTAAAARYRVDQARGLIQRIRIRVEPRSDLVVPLLIHLSDRSARQAGYRLTLPAIRDDGEAVTREEARRLLAAVDRAAMFPDIRGWPELRALRARILVVLGDGDESGDGSAGDGGAPSAAPAPRSDTGGATGRQRAGRSASRPGGR